MRGVTKSLKELAIGEQVTITGTARDNIYRFARKVGIKVKVEKFVGGFYVTRMDDMRIMFPAPIPGQTHWEVREGHSPQSEPIIIPVEDWRFTKDKPQFADDGRVYRKQMLAPDFKQARTVRVDEDDHERIVE